MSEEQEAQAPPEEVAPPETTGPPIDPDTAFNIVAERLGYDPREARFEFEDIKRQREEVARLRREAEQERRQYQERYTPQPEFSTPGEKALFDIVNEMREERRQEREERRAQEERQRFAEEQGMALRQAAHSVMVQSGIKAEEIDSKLPEFFQAMEEFYPEGIPARLGAYGAVRNVFRAWNPRGNPGPIQNGQPRMRASQREIVIPTATVPVRGQGEDDPRRRPGETTEQWVMRLRKMDEENGTPQARISDGQRIVID